MSEVSKIPVSHVLTDTCNGPLKQMLTAALCAAAWGSGCWWAGLHVSAAPIVSDSAGSTTVDNGLTRFVVDKNNGLLSSLTLGNLELLGGGGRVYFDANVAPLGTSSGSDYWRIGGTNTASYSFTTGSDFVDVAVSHAATSYMPFDVTQHFVMRDGEFGFHVYAEYGHTSAMADKSLVQTRMVMRGDPNLFDHHSVTDARFAVMPTPSQLSAGTVVQDATTRLNPGPAYEAETGKDVYTKYDWSLDNASREVIGMYGDTVGAWIVDPNRETHTGGPPKQHLTVHQTETTPVLLGMLQSTHYGTSKQIDFSGDKERQFGPFYVHLNTGPDHAAMRANAQTFADPTIHQSFYDTLNISGWAQTADRCKVTGRLNLVGGGDAAGATLILSDNNTDFQFATAGHQYWSKANPGGTFDVSGVSPGTYRLTAYVPGTYGELVIDNVVIGTGTTEQLGTLNWQPPDHGADLWQIGTFDRTTEEFLHGADDDYRQWGLWQDYPSEFPDGVNFVIGQSDEATDWNFAHWESSATDWEIEFEAGAIPAEKTATLTIATAGHRGGRILVFVNGEIADFFAMLDDSSILHRSGIRGAYSAREISFDTDRLIEGTNTIALRHISPNLNPANSEGIVYDALRLEVDLLADFDGDDDVDGNDFLQWQRRLGILDSAQLSDGDADFDGDVDRDDLAIWLQTYGDLGAAVGTENSQAVPEPTSLVVALVGIVMDLLVTRSRG